MPNAPFRKYQTSGFAFEAYSFAIHNAEKGVLTTLNNTQLNLNLTKKDYPKLDNPFQLLIHCMYKPPYFIHIYSIAEQLLLFLL